jgi:polysaccharide export outer membrane protein
MSKMKIILAWVAALMLLPFMVVQAAAQDYLLRPGDTVQIEVLEDGNLNRTAIVLPDGQISLPLAGSVKAAGRSLAQVQSDLAARLAPNFAAPPTVFLTLNALAPRTAAVARTIDVYIVGQAANSGLIAVAPDTTLLQAIAQAGGMSPFAAKKRVQLRRVDRSGVEKVYTFDFDAIERGAAAGGATRLADGDVIVVPQRRLFE